MQPLKVSDLYSLERYHALREEFRARVMAHKRRRQLPLGPNATLHFEDRLTMQYQIQEMLRAERIFEPEAIEEELAAYNPLIPDGGNFKATLMIEFPDPEERRLALERLAGIEDQIYLRVAGGERVAAIADEDLERASEGRTSAVHFLRFELGPEVRDAIRGGAPFAFGSGHPLYRHEAEVPPEVAESLRGDLD